MAFTLLGCNNSTSKNGTTLISDSLKMNEIAIVDSSRKTVATYKLVQGDEIDSTSFYTFWSNFKADILQQKSRSVLNSIKFPIHAEYPVLFRFACDCDTIHFIENEKKYGNFDINEQSFPEYFDFVFSKELILIISSISGKEILSGAIYEKNNSAKLLFTYEIFPKNFKVVKTQCPNDHNLKLHFYCDSGKWMVRFGGL